MRLKTKRTIDFWLGGVLTSLFFLPTLIVRTLSGRKNQTIRPTQITFLKLLGAGSVLHMLPLVSSLRKKYPDIQITIICSKNIHEFVRFYGVFDSIFVIDDTNVWSLFKTSVAIALKSFMRLDTVIDLEAYSKLTTAFSVMVWPKNRLALVGNSLFFARTFYTHFVRQSTNGPYYKSIDQLAPFFAIETIDVESARHALCQRAQQIPILEKNEDFWVSVGIGCSELSAERKLSPQSWATILRSLMEDSSNVHFILLGSSEDADAGEEILGLLPAQTKKSILNLCGQLSPAESCAVISQSDLYMGIDSSLLHIARFLDIPQISFWGPTHPSLLRPSRQRSLELYNDVVCSPCVHVFAKPICGGHHFCNSHLHRLKEIQSFYKMTREASRLKNHMFSGVENVF